MKNAMVAKQCLTYSGSYSSTSRNSSWPWPCHQLKLQQLVGMCCPACVFRVHYVDLELATSICVRAVSFELCSACRCMDTRSEYRNCHF